LEYTTGFSGHVLKGLRSDDSTGFSGLSGR
jgi:hypothetical protein